MYNCCGTGRLTLACYVSSASQGCSLVVKSPSTTYCGDGCSCFVDVCQTTTVHHIGRSVGFTLHTLVDDRHVAAGLEQSTHSANIKCGQQSGSEPSLREERWTRVLTLARKLQQTTRARKITVTFAGGPLKSYVRTRLPGKNIRGDNHTR